VFTITNTMLSKKLTHCQANYNIDTQQNIKRKLLLIILKLYFFKKTLQH